MRTTATARLQPTKAMSFDMYANGEHAAIRLHEEFMFTLVQADAQRFPALSALWKVYYDDPVIPPAQANALLHELIALLDKHGGASNKALSHTVLRLLPFFSMACQGGHEIHTESD